MFYSEEEKEKYKNFFDLETTYETKYLELNNTELISYRHNGQRISGKKKNPIVLLLHGIYECS